MALRRVAWIGVSAIVGLLLPDSVLVARQGGAVTGAQAGLAVPTDLKPLLAARISEMRLVTTRYTADRNTINANYAGPNGFHVSGGGRRGGGAAPGSGRPDPVSPARLARLKRFDLDWRAALGKLNVAKLSPAGARGL